MLYSGGSHTSTLRAPPSRTEIRYSGAAHRTYPATAEPRNSCHGFIDDQLHDFLVSQPEQLTQRVVVVLADFRARPRGSGRRPRETHPRSLNRDTTQPRMIQHDNVAASFELGVCEDVGAGRNAVNRYVNALQDFFERTGLKADRP